MSYIYKLGLVFLFSSSIYSADLIVKMDSSYKHKAWAEKPAELCDVVVKGSTVPKSPLFVSCETTVSKVRFMEPAVIDLTVQIDPLKIGSTPEEAQRNNHPIYVAARAKISEMEKKDKKFKKELESEVKLLFDDHAMFLSDAMYLILPLETEFTMYTKEGGLVSKGTLEQLSGR